jgi:hypothetical protein
VDTHWDITEAVDADLTDGDVCDGLNSLLAARSIDEPGEVVLVCARVA